MKFKCMYIDNDLEKLLYLSELFEGVACVEKFLDPREALRQLKTEHYDVVVVDINMPIMNGLDFIETVKTNNIAPKAKFFILSTMQDTETKIRGLSLKVSDYLSFEMSDEEIVLRITNQLSPKLEIERLNNLSLDTYHSVLSDGDSKISLTPLELRILRYIFSHKGKIEKKSSFKQNIWSENVVSRQTVNTHLYNLNKKISPLSYKFKRTKDRGASLQLC